MYYSCPEIIKNEPYNEKADIWAVGCVLYEMCCLEPPFCTSNMLALATKITQSDYDHDRLARNCYSAQVGLVVKNCLIIDPSKRPDIVGVASLIADKILTYTDTVRSKCTNLEKKLEKEKNKTQKMFCNKQDFNYLQRNSTKLTTESSNLEQDEAINTAQNSLISQSSQSKDNLPRPPKTSPPITQNRSNKENETLTTESVVTATRPTSSQITSSPNAKLPPIRHPKSKLIMKNLQNKQQIEQTKLAQSKLNSSNSSLNSENASTQTNADAATATENQEKNSNSQKVEVNTSKISRSSSSSMLEKR